jgi:hypothetical protein
MTHTPTPWAISPGTDSPDIKSETGDYVVSTGWSGYGGEAMAGEMSEEDAAFIVRAVNSHDKLVEALRRALDKAVADEMDGWYANAKAALEGLE